jgi:hypothetical protein
MPFSSTPSTNVVSGAPCESYCDGLCPGASGGADPTYWRCTVTQGYVDAFRAAQPDAGAADGGQDAGLVCPQWSSQVVIQCGPPPVGRGTEGATGPELCPDAGVAGVGSELADRAYLEAVSVHAFARLERELERHGAPPALLRDVRRARRDEVRHTAMMSRLARRFGGTPRAFATPAARPVRSLLAIALENAVEGCVRETYGAVVGLIEARTSSDAAVRRTMRSIAEDECRHAELAWAVAAWIAPRLTEDERRTVDGAMRRAVETLRQEGESRIVGLLTKRLWTEQARMAA